MSVSAYKLDGGSILMVSWTKDARMKVIGRPAMAVDAHEEILKLRSLADEMERIVKEIDADPKK